MKRTVACLAVIAAASAAVAAGPEKNEKRSPANEDASASIEGMTFVACKLTEPIFKGREAYKNSCATGVKTVTTGSGFGGPISFTGCEKGYQVVVSSTPISTRCLPPGVVEL